MKNILFLLLFTSISVAYSQSPIPQFNKRSIEFSDFSKWSYVAAPKISSNGKFAIYTIRNQPDSSNTLMIISTDKTWQKAFVNCTTYDAILTGDSHRLIFKCGDSLCIYNLKDTTTEFQALCSSFKLLDDTEDEWLAFKKPGDENEVVILNIKNKKEIKYSQVQSYYIMKSAGKIVVALKSEKKGEDLLLAINLRSSIADTIYKGNEVNDVIIDDNLPQLVFTVKEISDSIVYKSLWYYKTGLPIASLLIDTSIVCSNLTLQGAQRFSKDGSLVFLNLSKQEALTVKQRDFNVIVWSYLDPTLQSVQLKNISATYLGAINLRNKKIIQITNDSEKLQFEIPYKRISENYAVIIQREGNNSESNWNYKSKPAICLLNLINGERKQISIGKDIKSPYSFLLSSQERFLIYYDPFDKNYHSIELKNGVNRNITKGIDGYWTINNDEPSHSSTPLGFANFTENDQYVILYGKNDIFQVSLDGSKTPIIVTNGFGKKYNLVFRLAMDHSDSVFKTGEVIILNAFNTENKKNGFYKLTIGKQANPEYLNMSSKMFVGYDRTPIPIELPVKSKNSNTYLVRAMSSKESQNYFLTSDFKTFNQISFNYPEQNYNWLNAELINYRCLDGTRCQGILYKPENFDSTKKYPVIFYYYEKLSNCLNAFIKPQVSSGELNIPYFVSNGYLVFTPDIYYKIGYPGKSAYNSILGAAKLLLNYHWIDSKRMGLQGHSFGGYETNYLITQTNIFAAACSAAGVSNFISSYGSLIANGTSRSYLYENGQSRVGLSIWQNKNLYIENSPIFHAEKVNTPILLNNNGRDLQVPFGQGLEFFIALRRLGKKVWLLEYPNEGHTLDGKAAEDYTLKMKQFFDHYLKGIGAPKWMTRGGRTSINQTDERMEYDQEIKTPGKGLNN